MNITTEVGDLGKLTVVVDATKRGYNVSLPVSDGLRYDLVVERNGCLQKVQVKSVAPVNGCLQVPTKTMVFNKDQKGNNRNKMVTYKKGDFDWMAVVNTHTSDCYYVPIDRVVGRTALNLRLVAPKNRQKKRINFAADYQQW